MRHVVFSDLDGTLLDHHNYSFEAARPALEWLAKNHIPVVLISSKTAVEMQRLRSDMGLNHPFVCENGGGLLWPKGYFEGAPQAELESLALGATRAELAQFVEPFYKQYKFGGFSKLSAAQIAEATGLSLERAELAKQRQFSEPLLWQDREEAALELAQAAQAAGYQLVKGGRFWHLMGPSDKRKAMLHLCEKYQQLWGEAPLKVALGDSPNDRAMLEAADVAVAIQPVENQPLELNGPPKVLRPKGAGPLGWNEALGNYFGF